MEDDDDDFMVCLSADGRVDGSDGACLTAPMTWDDWLVLTGGTERLAALRAECQLAAWPLAAASFWLPADVSPDGPLEELAAQIFRFHTAHAVPAIDPTNCGCEWWANVTRSELLSSVGAGDIHMHFDKDEHAYESYGLVVHPLLSTVTYLSEKGGAPTVLLPHVSLDGAGAASAHYARTSSSSGARATALLVPPRLGRHLSFDGRWLHGAPAALAPADDGYERITLCATRPPNLEDLREAASSTLTAHFAASAWRRGPHAACC